MHIFFYLAQTKEEKKLREKSRHFCYSLFVSIYTGEKMWSFVQCDPTGLIGTL